MPSTILAYLDPLFLPFAEALLNKIQEERIPYIVTSTIRTLEDQQDAFRRGVSKCDGIHIKSQHQLGRAIDICAVNEHGNPSWDYAKYADIYRRIADIGTELGLENGADWYPSEYEKIGLGWDPPHHQYKA
jgi:hypothetical protein